MTLHEIENMTAADLKARRDELVAAIDRAHPADLAARYVQARLDAKLRDERMAEQGATITALQTGMAALEQKAADLDVKLLAEQALRKGKQAELETLTAETKEQFALMEQHSESEKAGHQVAMSTAKEEHAKAAQEAAAMIKQLALERDAARALCKDRRGGLVNIMNVITPLLASEA